jgi:hypothetical protein
VTTSIRQALFLVTLGLCTGSLLPSRSNAQEATQNPHEPQVESCGSCHRAGAWTPVEVPRGYRHADGRFALDGAHARVSCRSCHASLAFREASPTCAGCHTDVHRGELGTDCASCHTTRSFIDRAGMARAHQLTRFPLAGAHLMADCEACHAPAAQGQLRFVAAPSECESCHRAQLGSTTEPNHVAAGFTQGCESCHYPVAWNRARFDHAGTPFPLTGAHRGVSCAGCHADAVYRGTTAECAGCHQQDYDGTTNPNHAALGFVTTCASCHQTTAWAGATFDHDATFFPIYSGKHRGEWTGCQTCHTSPSNYAQFTCFACHEHSQAKMDDKHKEEPGYRYDSPTCLGCHPNGRKP